jgi:adenylate cyclase
MKKLILIVLPILILPILFQTIPTEILKLKTFDSLIKQQEPSGNFVILNITEDDVEREGGYPLPRKRLADIQMEILGKGALGVGWVISFPQADRLNGDKDFARSLGYAPSVIATFEDGNKNYPKTTGTVVKGPDVNGLYSTGVKQNYYLYKDIAQGVAIAPTEIDQLVRRIPLLLKTPDGWAPSFGTHVLKSLTGARTYIITTNDNGVQEIAVRGIPPVKTDSLGRKWISWVETEETNLQEMDVNGRFVFVGVTANGVMPQIATPVGLLEPHKIQAALAESILIQNSPYIPDWALALELLILIIGVLFIWFALHLLGVSLGVFTASVVMTITGGIGYLLISKGLLIDVTWSLIAEFIVASVAFYLRFREQYKLRQQIKKQFEHYLDPRQVKKLQNNPELLKLGGEKRYATYLFTDVRGFTSLSESVEPEQVTYIMNKALTAQQDAVQKYDGMVDKYIGDAMMAIFNAPIELKNHEDKAIKCAIQIQKNMIELNKELIKEGLPSVAIGIGINSGEAIIGNMGSESRFDYTAIGDAVNTAARFESSTKEVGKDLIIGQNTKQKSKFKLKLLKPIKVKGKAKALKIYTLLEVS